MPLAILSQDHDFLAMFPCCRRGDKILGFPVDNDEKLEDSVDVWRVPGGPPVLHYDVSTGARLSRMTGFLKKSPSAKFLEFTIVADADRVPRSQQQAESLGHLPRRGLAALRVDA